jgi:hypothetical protein
LSVGSGDLSKPRDAVEPLEDSTALPPLAVDRSEDMRLLRLRDGDAVRVDSRPNARRRQVGFVPGLGG